MPYLEECCARKLGSLSLVRERMDVSVRPMGVWQKTRFASHGVFTLARDTQLEMFGDWN